MKYRKDKFGNDISVLGFGCMRFTKKGNSIDFEKAEAEILKAYQGGVNYYDTAYIYSGSEVLLGKVLEKNNLRDKVNIATKLPQYMMKSIAQVEKTFNEELSRLRTTWIDYYLMHMITDIKSWENLKALGIEQWIDEKKKSRQIKQIGFSFHGNSAMFIEVLNAYDWDFCQIQYNYLDENTQAGRAGLEAAAQKGIPVIIMEPLRGGKLITQLPTEAKQLIANNNHGWTAAQWGLNWLWNQSPVTCVLSGMNSLEMVEENIKIASESEVGMLSDADFEVYETIKQEIRKKEQVGCTGCSYCMPCPKGVDIPATFSCYNRMFTENKKSGRWSYFQAVGLRKVPGFASQCVKCGKCEQHCPQGIKIRDNLDRADKALRPFRYRVMSSVARWFLKFN